MEGEIPINSDRRIALLIDGDNAQPSLLEALLTEVYKYGVVPIRRIYGDWTDSGMKGWKDALQTHAIQPIQQFAYTSGKNATDSALIIDAMDILADGVVEGLCIVSSDSDYTRLATRAREKGFFVMGIGRSETPSAFVNACETFIYTENLGITEPSKKSLQPTADKTEEEKPSTKAKDSKSSAARKLLVKAIKMTRQDDGWAFLGAVGHYLRQLDPGFDPRTYGESQLSSLVRKFPKVIEVKEKKKKGRTTVIHVRLSG